MSLVTVDQASTHLRIDPDDLLIPEILNDLLLKMEQASVLVLRHVGLPPDSYLDTSGLPVGVPFHLSAAVLIYLGYLFNVRNGESNENFGEIPRAVSSILVPYRNPSLS